MDIRFLKLTPLARTQDFAQEGATCFRRGPPQGIGPPGSPGAPGSHEEPFDGGGGGIVGPVSPADVGEKTPRVWENAIQFFTT